MKVFKTLVIYTKAKLLSNDSTLHIFCSYILEGNIYLNIFPGARDNSLKDYNIFFIQYMGRISNFLSYE